MRYTYRPGLDGARTLAVYLVVLFHAGVTWMAGGFIGVDLFFVLSGFLVSQVILAEIDERGTLDLGHFYARRVRRLLPAAVVVVVATAAAFVLISSVIRRLPLVADAQSALLYVANWRFLGQESDYFAADVDRSPYLHFWSLAIEEQFYVVFPAILLGLVVLARRRRWLLPAGLAALLLLSLAAQLYWRGVAPSHAYYGTDARLYQLLAGALLAVTMRSPGVRVPPRWLGTAGVAAILVLGSGLLDMTASTRGIAATVASVLLIAGVAGGRHGGTGYFLSGSALVYLGKISYGTYLWHWPIVLAVEELLAVGPLVLAIFAAVLSTGLAALSYQLLEMPIRRSRRLDRWRWQVTLTGVAASTTAAVLLVPPILQATRGPAVVAAEVELSPGAQKRPIPDDIDWEEVAGDSGFGHTCTVPEDCIVTQGTNGSVVLVGDSRARGLAPMFERLAEEHGFQLSVNILTGCPWQAGIVNFRRPREEREACVEAREGWYRDVLPELEPDLVILAANGYDHYTRAALGRVEDSGERVVELLANTTEETLGTFEELGVRALIIHSPLKARGLEPLDCLASSRFESQCTVTTPLATSPSDAFFIAADVGSADVYSVDINPVICPDAPLCRPILRGTVVWRDSGHLTASITVRLRRQIWDVIVGSGATEGLAVDR